MAPEKNRNTTRAACVLAAMRPLASALLSLGAALGLATAGCSTSPINRIDANRAAYESWPLEMQSAVLEGRAVKGMTPEMVRTALGAPTRVDVRSGANAEDEIWVYEKGGASGLNLPLPNIGIGGSIGGVGVSTGGRGGRGGGGSDPEHQEIVFKDGTVSRVE
jgi:hypothetical protein